MKKYVGFASFIVLSGFLATSNAKADPNIIEIGLSCPDASGTGSNTLSNSGSQIYGYGRESINSVPSPIQPFFKMSTKGGNFPARIANGNYSSVGTQFDPNTGVVTCSYTSGAGFSAINIPYKMTNAKGGVIIAQTVSTIVINQYVGLRKAS